MQARFFLWGFAMLIGSGCVTTQRPLATTKKESLGHVSLVGARFDSFGAHLQFRRFNCALVVVDRMCMSNEDPACLIERHEPTDCADANLAEAAATIGAPWGRSYQGLVSDGAADIPITWRDAEASEQRDVDAHRDGQWRVQVPSAGIDEVISVSGDDAASILKAIEAAQETGLANEKAELDVSFLPVHAIEAGKPNWIAVKVFNAGPSPAYRVSVQLRSSTEALHGVALSFGTVPAGGAKIRRQQIAIPEEIEDPNPVIVAVAHSDNGGSATRTLRVRVRVRETIQPARVELSCRPSSTSVNPGEMLRMSCSITNSGGAPAEGLKLSVRIRGLESPNAAPASLRPRETKAIEVAAPLPSTAGIGALVDVEVVAAWSTGSSAQSLQVQVTDAEYACAQGRVTRDQYRAKRKRLMAARDSGALTQVEFERYDEAMVGCLE